MARIDTGGVIPPDADSYLQRYSTTRYNPAPAPSLPNPRHVISNITRASLDYTREVFASLGSMSLKIPGLDFATIPEALNCIALHLRITESIESDLLSHDRHASITL